MKKLTTVMVTIFVLLLVIEMPCHGECERGNPCISNLAGTWSGEVDIVSGLGFFRDYNVSIKITEQDGHLFIGLITEHEYHPDFEVAPIFGAIVRCNEIRISTGQTVLFARISEYGKVMRGYYFSTDPLEEANGGWLVERSPHMATFTLKKQISD